MMKRLLAIVALFGLASCDAIKFIDSSKAKPETTTATSDKVIANLDVDKIATEDFKAELLGQFPEGANGADVEKIYAAKGFICSADPTKEGDRACTNAVTKDKCVIMSIVRTLPYTPNGAQVIKSCPPAQ